jgi:hypothetical protein
MDRRIEQPIATELIAFGTLNNLYKAIFSHFAMINKSLKNKPILN